MHQENRCDKSVAKTWQGRKTPHSPLPRANKTETAFSRKSPMKRRFFLFQQLSLVLYRATDECCRAGIGNLYHYTIADAIVVFVEYNGLVLFGTTT